MSGEQRRYYILGTAGHIDHGKTSLVRAMTGIDTDRLPEEKKRGITIDIGFARLDLGDVRLGVVDVPGHERFIKNMVAGASGVDLVLLVVAADDSVMPQTREHLEILQLLGVRHGAIALTKIDLVDRDWLELVEEDVRSLVEGTFLADAPIVRTSAETGEGIEQLKETLRAVCHRVSRERRDEFFRMAVDRSFAVQGYGTVVTGSVWSGVLRVGEEVEWLPAQKRLRVRSLQNHEEPVEVVRRGQRAAVNLGGVHHTEIQRGHEIATPGLLRPSHLISVELRVLRSSPLPVKHRRRVRLHVGTAETIAVVSLLDANELRPGEVGLAQLFTSDPVAVSWGQPFVVRAESPLVTLGGGRILQPVARRISRRHTERLERLEMLRSADVTERADAALWFYRFDPWTPLDLARDTGASRSELDSVLGELRGRGILQELPLRQRRTVLVHRDVLAALQQRLLRAVEELHRSAPLRLYHPAHQVLSLVQGVAEEAVLQALLERLLKQGELVGSPSALARRGHTPKLTQAETRLKESLVQEITANRFTPPDLGALVRASGAKEETVRQLLELAAAEGALVAVSETIYLASTVAEQLRAAVREALERKPEGMTVAEIRDLLGVSRKYAVPYCEYLDRIGLTERRGDLRVLASPTAAGAASAEGASESSG